MREACCIRLKGNSGWAGVLPGALSIGREGAGVKPAASLSPVGLAVAWVPVALLLGSLWFIVGGYEVKGTDPYIKRLFTASRIPLAGLSKVWLEPKVCKCSIRVFGNGGLFSSHIPQVRPFTADSAPEAVIVLAILVRRLGLRVMIGEPSHQERKSQPADKL